MTVLYNVDVIMVTPVNTSFSCHRLLADVYNTRGHIKYLWVDFNEAVEDYTAAITTDPTHAVAFYNRGQVHYRMGGWS